MKKQTNHTEIMDYTRIDKMIDFYSQSPDGQWDLDVVEVLKEYKDAMIKYKDAAEWMERGEKLGTQNDWNCYHLLAKGGNVISVAGLFDMTAEEVISASERIKHLIKGALQDYSIDKGINILNEDDII